MTPQELKNSILQLAIQGKLVEQRPEEGTGEELHWQIQAEKQRLIKEGKIKKEKPLAEIADNEIPFDIPESWRWVRLSQLVSVLNGDRGKNYPAKSTLSHKGIPFISALNLDGKSVVEDDNLRCLSEQQYEKLGNGKLIRDDIVVCIRGSLGKHGRYPFDKGAIASSLVILRPFINEDVMAEFLMMYLDTPLFFSEIRRYDNGTAQPNLAAKSLEQFLLPLPPLAEQKRIVAKIEELLPLIDRYEKAWTKLEDFNKRFPGDMQKSLLQMAIQGKLVEQRPEEGTGEELYRQIQAEKQRLIKDGRIKKDKPLPEIAEDEKPFDIPESWKWVRFGEVYTLSNGIASRGSKEGISRPVLRLADLSDGIIDTSQIRNIELTEKEFQSHQVAKDDLIFIRVNGSKDRVATAFHYTDTATVSYCDHLFCGHRYSKGILVEYMMYIFNAASTRKQLIPEIKTTAGQNTISQTSMAKILLPLPPLAEQKRIVAKLDELLLLCEKLK